MGNCSQPVGFLDQLDLLTNEGSLELFFHEGGYLRREVYILILYEHGQTYPCKI